MASCWPTALKASNWPATLLAYMKVFNVRITPTQEQQWATTAAICDKLASTRSFHILLPSTPDNEPACALLRNSCLAWTDADGPERFPKCTDRRRSRREGDPFDPILERRALHKCYSSLHLSSEICQIRQQSVLLRSWLARLTHNVNAIFILDITAIAVVTCEYERHA